MESETIKELGKIIHADAQRQGFWEDANLLQKRALVVCELAEAIEADRKGRRADMQAMQKRIDEICASANGED